MMLGSFAGVYLKFKKPVEVKAEESAKDVEQKDTKKRRTTQKKETSTKKK